MSFAEIPEKPSHSSSGSSAVILAVGLIVAAGLMFVCGGLLLVLLLPAVQAGREAARRTEVMNNLQQIKIAVQQYHEAYAVPPNVESESE